MRMRKTAVLGVMMMAMTALANGVAAKPIWICSIVRAVQCDDDGTTGPPDLQGLAQPTFMRVDLDKKLVTLLGPKERRGETTKIDNVFHGEGVWILSGVEKNRGWSMIISDAGYMTLSVTDDGAVWSVFGSALRENEQEKK